VWRWHTRVWVEDGAVHELAVCGWGWYLVLFVLIFVIGVIRIVGSK